MIRMEGFRYPLKRLLDEYSREAETGHLTAQLRNQKKMSVQFVTKRFAFV
jgi:hypothetical protein